MCFKYYNNDVSNWVFTTNLNVIYIRIDEVEEAVDDVVGDAVEGAVKYVGVGNLLP